MRPRRLLRVLLVLPALASVGLPARAAPDVVLGPPQRLVSPRDGLCPVGSEPQITVTRAGTWVAYNDLADCGFNPLVTRATSLQLLPARGGPARYIALPVKDPAPHTPVVIIGNPASVDGDIMVGDPDVAPDPRGDGIVLQSMYYDGKASAFRVVQRRVSAGGTVSDLPLIGDRNDSVDKPFFATDTGVGSRYRGRMYAAWDDTLSGTVFAAFDGRSWSPSVLLADRAGYPDVTVGPRGEVAVAYEVDAGIAVRVSRDGGRRFTEAVMALTGGLPGQASPVCPLYPSIGRQRVLRAVQTGYDRAGALHVVAALGSTYFGPIGGAVVPSTGEAVVWHAVSRDGGRTFQRQRVSPEAGPSFHPALAKLPGGGVAVAFLSAAEPQRISYDAWLSVNRSGTGRFSNPVRLSPATASLPPVQEAYGASTCYGLGDYIGLATTHRGVVAVWPTTEGTTGPNDTDLYVREAVVK